MGNSNKKINVGADLDEGVEACGLLRGIYLALSGITDNTSSV